MRRLASLSIFAVFLFLFFPLLAHAERIAVLDFEGNVEKAEAATVQEFVIQELSRYKRYEVLGGKDIRDLLKVEREKMVLNTSSSADLSRIAAASRADYIVTGTLREQGGKKLLSLRLLDSEKMKVSARETVQLEGSGTELIPQVASLIRQLFGADGVLQIFNQVDGAVVYLNNRKLGTMPLDKVNVPQSGTYELKILHDDYAPYEKTIQIEPGSLTRVAPRMLSYVELEERSESRSAWGWGILGIGAAVAGVGGWQYTQAVALRSDYESELGRSVPADQEVAQRDRLTRMNDDANDTYVLAQGLGGAGLAGILAGSYMLVFNPWEDELEAFAGARPDVLPGTAGPSLAMSWDF